MLRHLSAPMGTRLAITSNLGMPQETVVIDSSGSLLGRKHAPSWVQL